MPFALYRDQTRVSDVFDEQPNLWRYVRENGFCEEAVGNEWQDATRVLRSGYVIFECTAQGVATDGPPEKNWV